MACLSLAVVAYLLKVQMRYENRHLLLAAHIVTHFDPSALSAPLQAKREMLSPVDAEMRSQGVV